VQSWTSTSEERRTIPGLFLIRSTRAFARSRYSAPGYCSARVLTCCRIEGAFPAMRPVVRHSCIPVHGRIAGLHQRQHA